MEEGIARTATSISIVGDKQYVSAVKAIAAIRGLRIADVVRSAVDAYIGAEIEKALKLNEGTLNVTTKPASPAT